MIEIPAFVGTIKRVWQTVGIVITILGISIPFVTPDLFTVEVFEILKDSIVAIIGLALTIWNTIRGVEDPKTPAAQSFFAKAKKDQKATQEQIDRFAARSRFGFGPRYFV